MGELCNTDNDRLSSALESLTRPVISWAGCSGIWGWQESSILMRFVCFFLPASRNRTHQWEKPGKKKQTQKNERKIKSDLSRVRTQVVPLSKCNIPGYFTIKLDAPWLILGMLAGETRQCVKNRRNFTQEIREFTRLHKTCSGTSNLGRFHFAKKCVSLT